MMRNVAFISISLILLLLANTSIAMTSKSTLQTTRTVAGVPVSISVKAIDFDPKRHDISTDKVGNATVDGQLPLGTDGGLPNTELVFIEVGWAEHKIKLPGKALEGIFDPNIGNDYFRFALSEDKATLLIWMFGADGAGAYEVLWVVRSDGSVHRFIGDCCDCGFMEGILY